MGAIYAIDKCPHCGLPIRKRSSEQNRGLHSAIGQIAEQLDWPRGSGIKRDAEYFWKPMLKFAFLRSEGVSAEMHPALDGKGMDVISPHTSRMSKEQLSEIFDFVVAWGTENGVKWTKEAA